MWGHKTRASLFNSKHLLKLSSQHVVPILKPLSATAALSTRSFDPNPGSEGARLGEVILVTKRGVDILGDPLFNKGSGFRLSERERLGIRGLVPPRIYPRGEELKNAAARIMLRYHQLDDPLEKYQYLIDLQDRNETLFYRVLIDNIEDMAPIIYTPTVGKACQLFGHLWKRPRGMYFCSKDQGNMHAMVYNWPSDDVQVIVVTDGSRILGLGDLGCNGMGIPIGKLSLYTAGAGIHPSRCLPVMIDVGTNNQKLLDDPLYLGLQQKRTTGEEYLKTIDEFIHAVQERWPRVLVQFEDFSNENAARLLEKYQHSILCFNDDIQGTGCVSVAGVLAALRAIGIEGKDALCKQKIIIAGAGSAGVGVANALNKAMVQMGLSSAEAHQRFWLVDQYGLLGSGRENLAPNQTPYLRKDLKDRLSLYETVSHVKPTILFGLTGVGGLFTESVIREMASHVERPIVFPLSNPTANAECSAKQAYEWTNGRCLFASGSPFDPVTISGRTLYPSQANNMYVFPGIGLGAVVGGASVISDSMLLAASQRLSELVSWQDLKDGKLFPRLKDIREVSLEVAIAVALQAQADGTLRKPEKWHNKEQLRKLLIREVWDPTYGSLVWVPEIPPPIVS